MTACKRADDLVQHALSYGWSAEAEYGYDIDEQCELVDVALSWSDKNAWAIGAIVRWYRSGSGWRMAQLDGKGGQPIAGMAEWIPDRTDVEFTLPSLWLLRTYIADRTDLVAWLDRQREAKQAARVPSSPALNGSMGRA